MARTLVILLLGLLESSLYTAGLKSFESFKVELFLQPLEEGTFGHGAKVSETSLPGKTLECGNGRGIPCLHGQGR